MDCISIEDLNARVFNSVFLSRRMRTIRKFYMKRGKCERKRVPDSLPTDEKLGILCDVDGECIEFVGTRDPNGYGKMRLKGKDYLAHRLSYIEFVGELKDEDVLMHTCDNPSCINPDHLVVGTQIDNIADCVKKRRHSYGEKNSKLTEEEVLEIRARLRNGETHRTIAKDYPVSYGTIGDISRRKSWKHLNRSDI